MPGCSTMCCPTTPPRPVTTLTTPGGRCSSRSCASRRTESGASSAGLTTRVLPAARAAGIFIPAIIRGEFQGRIAPTTPRGSRREYCSWPSPAGSTVPLNSPATPAKYRNSDTRMDVSGRVWVCSALPVSWAVSTASSSDRSSRARATRSSRAARSRKWRARHSGRAAVAAATAASTSSGRPSGTRASTTPRRAGVSTSRHAPEAEGTQRPPISMGHRGAAVIAGSSIVVRSIISWPSRGGVDRPVR